MGIFFFPKALGNSGITGFRKHTHTHTHTRAHVYTHTQGDPGGADNTVGLSQDLITVGSLGPLPHRVIEPFLDREDPLLIDSVGGLEQLADYLAGGFCFQSELVSMCTGFG